LSENSSREERYAALSEIYLAKALDAGRSSQCVMPLLKVTVVLSKSLRCLIKACAIAMSIYLTLKSRLSIGYLTIAKIRYVFL
jgi:hypothetical protein